MLQGFLDFFKRLFRIGTQTTNAKQAENVGYIARYEDITNVNFVWMIANKLANIVFSDSDIYITDENERSKFLNDTLQLFIVNLKNVISRVLGTGGVILKPFVHKDKIQVNILGQERFFVVEQNGNEIVKAGFVAEIVEQDGKLITRFEYHSLEPNGIYVIEQKAISDDAEVSLSSVAAWSDFQPVTRLSGVDKMLFSIMKCPVDNRRQFSNVYGVPITYGQDELISEIVDMLSEMYKELKDKRTFIGVADVLFDGSNTLPQKAIYKKFSSDNENFFEIFSPSIREMSYINSLNYKMELLEKSIGVSKGVLTNLDTRAATATEIRRSTFDTFAVVDTIRSTIESSIKQLVYAFDVFATVNNLAPSGEYEIVFDWDYSLLEDMQERFNQLVGAAAAGWVKPEEGRAWVMNESVEVAKENLPELGLPVSE